MKIVTMKMLSAVLLDTVLPLCIGSIIGISLSALLFLILL